MDQILFDQSIYNYLKKRYSYSLKMAFLSKLVHTVQIIFAWVRLLIVIGILYVYLYEYLYKKYQPHLNDYDSFFWHDKYIDSTQFYQFFNFTQKSITGQQLSSKSSNLSSHVGPFSQYISSEYMQKSCHIHKTLSQLFGKKVDSYIFNFYNWYRFEFTFTDLGHDSFIEFRVTQQQKGSHQIIQKVSFRLPQNFYPQTVEDLQNSFNLILNAEGISLNISQITTAPHYDDKHSDGLVQQDYFFLTPNKTQLTAQQFKKFGSAKTLTNFQFIFARKDYEIRANMTHVIRHNQCVTNNQNGVLRHKCMGGYSKGKLYFNHFIRHEIHKTQKHYSGNWQRHVFNLDNMRARTTFVGYRYPATYLQSYVPNVNMKTFEITKKPQWNLKTLEIDFIGFDKLEYYSKHDNIEKQRWLGMSIYAPLDINGKLSESLTHQSYFFVNGNMHPIHEIDFELPLTNEGLKKGNKITFSNLNSSQHKTPTFDIQFKIHNSTLIQSNGVFDNKQIYRVDGYWKGWIDEGNLFQNQTLRTHYNQTFQFGYVKFYEIMGTIKLSQQIY